MTIHVHLQTLALAALLGALAGTAAAQTPPPVGQNPVPTPHSTGNTDTGITHDAANGASGSANTLQSHGVGTTGIVNSNAQNIMPQGKHRYVYYSTAKVYYGTDSGLYYYQMDDGTWVSGKDAPAGVKLGKGRPTTISGNAGM